MTPMPPTHEAPARRRECPCGSRRSGSRPAAQAGSSPGGSPRAHRACRRPTPHPPPVAARGPSLRLPACLERIRVAAALDSDPGQLGELVDRGAAPEASPAAVLDTPKGHLRLVADRLLVDVHDAG